MSIMSNPMFDDFIELDLLDTSETNSEMFSYYLGGAPDLDDNATDLGAAAVTLSATPENDNSVDSILGMDLVIKQEDVSDSESHMLLDPTPLSQQPLELSTDSHSKLVFGEGDMTVVSPDQMTFAPQATTVSLATISLSTASPSTTVSTTTVDATSCSPNAISISTSTKASSTATKRSSPEPSANPRKHAKTESVSKSKSSNTSSRKSSTSSASSGSSSNSSSKAASATKSTSQSPSSPSSISSSPSPSSKSSEASKESLTSTPNTTLSPATLQFLLQQQEETPLIPQLFTGKLSREEIEATLARLLESTKHLIATPDEPVKIKEEAPSDDESDDNMDGSENNEASEQTHGLKTQPGIKTDDIPSSTDLKKMTSKERRQLRNKISARNFRVRRKEYIFTLEGQVLQHKTEARHLREAVTLVQEENIKLKNELELVRRQLADATISNSAAAAGANVALATSSTEQTQTGSASPLSKENQSLLASILNRNVNSAMNPNVKSNVTLTMPRPQSPILTPNLHKDVPNSSSGSANQNPWKEKKPIMVHTTLVPEVCFGEEFQFGSKVTQSKDETMFDRPWMKLGESVQESKSNINPFWVSGVVFELMQTFVSTTLTMNPLLGSECESAVQEVIGSQVDSDAELDWELQQNVWALTQMDDGEEMTDEQIELLYDLSQLQISNSQTNSSTPAQEDPNMLEWLYESMMARLVDMDLQGSQDQSSYSSFPDAHLA